MQADKDHDTKIPSKLLPHGVSHDPATVIVNTENQCCERTTSADISSGVVSSTVSTSLNPAVDVSFRHLGATSTEMVPPQGSEFTRSTKVKLPLDEPCSIHLELSIDFILVQYIYFGTRLFHILNLESSTICLCF